MNEIRLRDFRCFRDEQKARLAPLTLLVGENSTGKTSFLALIRALWDLGYGDAFPDFKEDPYDLGSFDEIAHHRGARGGRATMFDAGFTGTPPRQPSARPALEEDRSFDFTFARDRNQPALAKRSVRHGNTFIELDLGSETISIGTSNGSWQRGLDPRLLLIDRVLDDQRSLLSWNALRFLLFSEEQNGEDAQGSVWTSRHGPASPSTEDLEHLRELAGANLLLHIGGRPYASAPVRSKPRRTYDPSRLTHDPEGEAIPMYLADASYRRRRTWTALHGALENFGRASGLFDEIRVRRLGRTSSEPFQIQVRKSGSSRLKGPWRNLTDVGYGISQVLPVITELLRSDAAKMFLLQQPEVHLHPSAQAALGTLFCSVAAGDKQLIVETHGDHLIDRVRMDVRDRTTRLRPEDVSILFFERRALGVRIFSLVIDDAGNVLGAPASYRRFFMEETNRSIGL
jgi:hypothetical protein